MEIALGPIGSVVLIGLVIAGRRLESRRSSLRYGKHGGGRGSGIVSHPGCTPLATTAIVLVPDV
jgi:hypothetical protein